MSYTNRENLSYNKFKDKNSSLITISLNEGHANNSRKINNIYKKKDFSLKIRNKKPFLPKKIIFDKKIFISKKNDSKNNRKTIKNNIPISKYKFNYESLLKNDKNKTIENKNIMKNILELFKKKRYDSNKKEHSNNINIINNNNVFKKLKFHNISIYNLDKDNKIKNYTERLRNQKTYFSNLE